MGQSRKVVDIAGKPVGGVTVSAPGHSKCKPVTSAADGTFFLTVGSETRDWLYVQLLARGPDGRLGIHTADPRAQQQLQVVLKPARDLSVSVADGQGGSVAGAEIFVLAPYEVVCRGRSDAGGEWRGRVPLDATDWAVFAHKPGVGLDFALARPFNNRDEPLRPLPDRVTLKLEGGRSVRVRTFDYQGKPLQGVRVGPSILLKPGLNAPLNLSGTTEIWPLSDKDGRAVIDWLPARVEHGVEVTAVSDDYAIESGNYVRNDEPEEELKFYLRPRERISGRVTDAGGLPAAGVLVEARGQSARGDCRAIALTNSDGSYRMKVYSDYTYAVVADRGELAAPYRAGIRVRADEPVKGVDFVLGKATPSTGRVTVGKDNRPAEDIPISVIIDSNPQPVDARHGARATLGSYRMTHSEVTDKDGRYAFRLGPGDYWLDGPMGTEMERVRIPAVARPAGIVRDYHITRPEVGRLTARVVDASGKPVVAAAVMGRHNTGAQSQWIFEAKTDAKGTFTTRRPLEPAMIYARTADRSLGGLARLPADDQKAEIVVAPCATAAGRLLDRHGKALGARQLTYGIRVWFTEPGRGESMDSFGGTAVTDAAGQFSRTGLIPGQTYYLMLAIDSTRFQQISEVRPKDSGPLDLGEVSVDAGSP